MAYMLKKAALYLIDFTFFLNKPHGMKKGEVKIQIDKIELVDIKKLKPNPDNRNIHTKAQIKELARHYKTQGMRTPIIVSKQSKKIVAGNGRFEAAKLAGLKKVPVSYQNFSSPEQEYAFHIADNGLSAWSTLDFSQINIDIQDLGPKFNLSDLGIENFVVDVADKGFSPGESSEKDKEKHKRCPHCGEIL